MTRARLKIVHPAPSKHDFSGRAKAELAERGGETVTGPAMKKRGNFETYMVLLLLDPLTGRRCCCFERVACLDHAGMPLFASRFENRNLA
jgi:hypothetical protein